MNTNTISNEIEKYLFYCKNQRRLDEKTINAYKNDLKQFCKYYGGGYLQVHKEVITSFIVSMHEEYKPKTVKRKIASMKAFFNYLENEEIIEVNPFHKIRTEFREDIVLPKTIPMNIVEILLDYMYTLQKRKNISDWERKIIARDIAVIEFLFATGVRISELCNMEISKVDMTEGIFRIKGKGSKERYLQIGNQEVIRQLYKYIDEWKSEISENKYFFVNRYGNRYSEQAARKMINKYAEEATISLHITPHMFRHAFATLLLEEDVDIRYIQKMLGHSSIVTTQIYAEVTCKKQMEILRTKHPRNKITVCNR